MTTPTLREAAEKAYAALLPHKSKALRWYTKEDEAIDALRAALKGESVQEPVRLQCVHCGTVYAEGVPPAVASTEGWQPIATIPAGVDVLLLLADGKMLVHKLKVKSSMVWSSQYPQGKTTNWHSFDGLNPTHWMPLPAAPKKED